MSFEIQSWLKARSKRQSALLLLFGGILCGFTAMQSEAAPLSAAGPAKIAVTVAKPTVQHTSIWAIKWAAAHPAEEAQYLARLAAERSQDRTLARRRAITSIMIVKPTPTVAVALAKVKASSLSANIAGVTPASTSPTPTTGYSGSEQQRRAAPSDEVTTGDVTLDFVAADINDVLKALAVQTHANIVSGADVKGTVTVSLAHVTLDEALQMITRLSGFHYAKVGSTYVVGSASGITSLTGADDAHTPVTTVVRFDYATFKDLKTVIEANFPSLTVTNGGASDLENGGSLYKAIVLSGDPGVVADAQALVSQIDGSFRQTALDQSTVVYNVVYASPTDLMKTVQALVPNVIINEGPMQGFGEKTLITDDGGAASGSGSGSAGSGSEAGSSPASSGPVINIGSAGGGNAAAPNPENANSSAPGLKSSGGQKRPSKTNLDAKLLLLTGTADDIARAQKILSEIDVRPVQILYDTKVSEVDITKVNNLGLNWDFTGATTTIGEEPVTAAAGSSSSSSSSPLGNNNQKNLLSFGAIGRTAITDLATLTLDALITNGNAKLLADPNISAIDGQPAEVFIGNTVNYVQSITQTTTGENVTTASVQVGVTLNVTGVVGSDGYITLDIHPEVSEITGYLSVPGGGSLPQTANRYADTVVRVKNGETVAIGGLIQENDTKGVNKVPGLGDLPFVGKLFQDSQDNKTRTEIVFLLTTKIAN